MTAVCGAFLLTAQKSVAQEVTQPDSIKTIRTDTLPTLVITRTTVVSQKIADSFNRTFKNAVNPQWYQLNKNYLVKFIMEDQRNNALFDKSGYLIYHISYGTEKNLPFDVRDQVQNQYPKGKILTAIHVDQDNRSVWIVNVESGKYLYLTRVEDGQLDEVERMRNASAD